MAQNSKIEWTDHTVNLWWGCTKVHTGCDNCYAESLSKRFGDNVWGNENPRKEIKSAFKDLAKYQKLAESKNTIHKVFVGSMMDIFEKPMPLVNAKGEQNTKEHTGNLRFQFFYRIDRGDYPNLMFLLLTKRPSNINKMIFESWKTEPPKNVMFGTSPVNQQTFDTLTRHLLEVNGKRFLSIEPQLDLISIPSDLYKGIDWIIQGGESGHNKRTFNLDWAYSMKQDCKDLNIPYFFKQIDKIKPIPEDLLIREFPNL